MDMRGPLFRDATKRPLEKLRYISRPSPFVRNLKLKQEATACVTFSCVIFLLLKDRSASMWSTRVQPSLVSKSMSDLSRSWRKRWDIAFDTCTALLSQEFLFDIVPMRMATLCNYPF